MLDSFFQGSMAKVASQSTDIMRGRYNDNSLYVFMGGTQRSGVVVSPAMWVVYLLISLLFSFLCVAPDRHFLYPFPRNGFASMIKTGAKGSNVNYAMICVFLGSSLLLSFFSVSLKNLSCLSSQSTLCYNNPTHLLCRLYAGQQSLEGRRVKPMSSGRSLPAFAPADFGSMARGFVLSSFLSGTESLFSFGCICCLSACLLLALSLAPHQSRLRRIRMPALSLVFGFSGLREEEFYFHCMAGREGLIDTAVKTAKYVGRNEGSWLGSYTLRVYFVL